ncbi:MAG: DedA family protein [Phycisphaerales bacterium]|nr:DedA family protein [Phycisphaerales bacterium]
MKPSEYISGRLRPLLLLLVCTLVCLGWEAGPEAGHEAAQKMHEGHSISGKAEQAVADWVGPMGVWGPAVLAGIILLAGVGIPVSEEILVIPAGFLVARGVFDLWWTLGLIWAAVVLADLIWMLLVRRYAHVLLRKKFFRRMFHPRRILEIKHLLDRWGMWVIVMGRVLPAARTPTITAAGLAHMKVRPFLAGEALGAAKSVGWQLLVGWLIAKGLTSSSSSAHIEHAVLIGIGVALIVAAIWWHRRKKSRRPRARMRWLRDAARGVVPS